MVEWRLARSGLGLLLASLAALGSALAVVYSVHSARLLVNELQLLQREGEQLQVQWGQLLLEKSTWGSYASVERRARSELDMYLPSVQEIVVVEP